ncbi:MAG: cyclic nucleotide-binding domain-containing protein [Acidimicrobiia bacterium]|nr:cyclic nucleotide-binding domain-containing protein [Acidimicrobiia bacterium]
MRYQSTATSLSWIPSEAVTGMTKLPFDSGVAHYDATPPEVLEDLEALRDADRFRFANRVTAWIEVEDGKIVGHGQEGSGMIGSTTMKLGSRSTTITAFPLPDIQVEPEVGDGWVRFVQTAGGRTGVPTPRRVNHAPFIQITAPLAWSTVALTLHADGRAEPELAGASPFPRHWLYDDSGKVVAKTGVIDFKKWYRNAFGKHSPWGDEDSPALVTAVETALERQLSEQVMKAGEKPDIRKVKKGNLLTEQGKPGNELFLLLDGVLSVEVDGEALAELGPGALLGERAVIEGGLRTSTLRAVTKCTVACASGEHIDKAVLAEVAEGHRREEQQA